MASRLVFRVSLCAILVVVPFSMTMVNAATLGSTTCDRERSREAQQILDMDVYPAIEEFEYDFPSSCPLIVDASVYVAQELMKRRIRTDNWKCESCGKGFLSEAYLDKHMDNRHSEDLDHSRVCLADYCDFLHCDERDDIPQQCNEQAMARKRHQCRATIQRCFPASEEHHNEDDEVDYETAHQLNELFVHTYCDKLNCEYVATGERPSMAARAQAKVDDSSSSKLRIVWAVIIGILLSVFYIGVWLYKREMATGADLRHRTNRWSVQRMLSSLTPGSKRLKGY